MSSSSTKIRTISPLLLLHSLSDKPVHLLLFLLTRDFSMATNENQSPPKEPFIGPSNLTGFSRAFFKYLTSSPTLEAIDVNNLSPFESPPFQKTLFFFYGSLMDSTTLTKVLNLTEPPILQPATIIGYSYKLWGRYWTSGC